MTKPKEGPCKYCPECGCEMIWNNPADAKPVWICPSCTHDRLKFAEREIKEQENEIKRLTEIVGQLEVKLYQKDTLKRLGRA